MTKPTLPKMISSPRLGLLLAAAAVLSSGPASAHPGTAHVHGIASGLASGFVHPVTGIDHVLAMIAVGLLAALAGGRALWALPASFLGMMTVGAALGMVGLNLPFVESVIAASVVVLGAAVALGWTAPVGLSVGLVGSFALFHGAAHGAELPAGADAAGYAAGFLAATALLHGVGILAVRGAGPVGRTAVRIAGAAIAVMGAGLLSGAL